MFEKRVIIRQFFRFAMNCLWNKNIKKWNVTYNNAHSFIIAFEMDSLEIWLVEVVSFFHRVEITTASLRLTASVDSAWPVTFVAQISKVKIYIYSTSDSLTIRLSGSKRSQNVDFNRYTTLFHATRILLPEIWSKAKQISSFKNFSLHLIDSSW